MITVSLNRFQGFRLNIQPAAVKLHASTIKNYHLAHEQIDIWQFSLKKPPAKAETILNEDENNRAQRFYFEHHRRRFIAAHAFLRIILARYARNEPHLLQFISNNHGKPALYQGSDLQFNLSHSEDTALLAVGKHYPLGIDLEYFSARPYLGIGQELFSPLELQAYQKVPEYAQAFSFFHIWAQKEAFIKACGLGLAYPTRTFTVHAWPLEEQFVYDPLHQKKWKIKSFMPSIACAAALCFDPAITQFRYHILDA